MKKIKYKIKSNKVLYSICLFFYTFFQDLINCFLNYFVAFIPLWILRKFFYVLFGMKIGKRSRIGKGCTIIGCKGISIGNDNVINDHVLLDGRSKLFIGDHNSISMYAKIYTGTHKSYSNTFEYSGVVTSIKNNCWIGTAAVVMPGSEVNDFTIISVNSVFKGISEEKGIYIGNPAELKRKRDIQNHYSLSGFMIL